MMNSTVQCQHTHGDHNEVDWEVAAEDDNLTDTVGRKKVAHTQEAVGDSTDQGMEPAYVTRD